MSNLAENLPNLQNEDFNHLEVDVEMFISHTLSYAHWALYHHITRFQNSRFHVPNQETLAKIMGKNRTTISEYIADFKNAGLLQTYQPKKGGVFGRNRYDFTRLYEKARGFAASLIPDEEWAAPSNSTVSGKADSGKPKSPKNTHFTVSGKADTNKDLKDLKDFKIKDSKIKDLKTQNPSVNQVKLIDILEPEYQTWQKSKPDFVTQDKIIEAININYSRFIENQYITLETFIFAMKRFLDYAAKSEQNGGKKINFYTSYFTKIIENQWNPRRKKQGNSPSDAQKGVIVEFNGESKGNGSTSPQKPKRGQENAGYTPRRNTDQSDLDKKMTEKMLQAQKDYPQEPKTEPQEGSKMSIDEMMEALKNPKRWDDTEYRKTVGK